MDSEVVFIRGIDGVDQWRRFVRCKRFWAGQPHVIRELEYKWLAFSCVDPLLSESDEGEFWDAVRNLNREEHRKGTAAAVDEQQRSEGELNNSDDEPEVKRRKLDEPGSSKYICRLEKKGRPCLQEFTSKEHLTRHQLYVHNPDSKKWKCETCDKAFRDNFNFKNHKCQRQGPPSPAASAAVPVAPRLADLPTPEIVNGYLRDLRRRNRNGRLTMFRFTPLVATDDYNQVLQDVSAQTAGLIELGLEEHRALKYQMKMMATFYKDTEPNVKAQNAFGPKAVTVLQDELFQGELSKVCKTIEAWVVGFMEKGSGWILQRVDFVDLAIIGYNPIGGGTYIATPKGLMKSIVNIQSDDGKCFLWCVLAAIYPVDRNSHPNNLNHYAHRIGEFNVAGIQFPMAIEQIGLFEELNNIPVNVYGYEKQRGLFPLRITKRRDEPKRVVHLLLLSSGNNAHYCVVRDLDRLLSHIHKSGHKVFHCQFCLCHFTTEARRDQHIPFCQTGNQAVEMPENGEVVKFRNIKNQMRAPLVIYADFECFVAPIQGCTPNPAVSSSVRTHNHIANSFAAICARGCGCNNTTTKFEDFFLHRGADSPKQFLEYCIRMGKSFQRLYDDVKDIDMSDVEKAQYPTETVCCICLEDIARSATNVQDHCHICGRYRGAAHQKCNLELRQQRTVTVVLHNLRRYDSHLIMQQLGDVARAHKAKIDCVPKGMEDYLTFSLTIEHLFASGRKTSWKLRFIDSFQFLASSLESLTSNLLGKDGSGESKFLALKSKFPESEDRKLLLRKGIYPYEFVDKAEKFKLKELPAKEKFYSSLKGEGVKDADYDHAENVWNHFKCADFGVYHDIYLTCDVLLLADVFEGFRQNSFKHYKLDPAHYITLPSFAWDACLKFTKVKLELLTDPDMYQFFEQSIRGGISVISGRHAKANNPLVDGYDPTKETTFIKYYDANNLYGWSMLQYLPTNEFKWLTEDQLGDLQLEGWPDDDPDGAVLEVDLDYPDELHDEHNDYPLAPESLLIKDEMLSDYSLELKEQLNMTSGGDVRKLTPNLFNKHHYIVHYRILKYYIAQGMKLKKIHRGISFRQSPWMKQYIEFNTHQRTLATTSFEKDFFKLLNNAVFGKSMENIRKYRDIRIVADDEKLQKLVTNPAFVELREFGGKLFAVSLEKTVIQLNKPIYTGGAVLDDAKKLMYEFHYGYIKPKFGDRSTLLFTDTDSLCYSIKSDDVYKEIQPDSDRFDFSDYPQDHFLYSEVNKKVIGKMKDETNSVPIAEFVGLRAKMYSLLVGGKEKKRGKGIAKSVVEKTIRHKDFVAALFDKKKQRHEMMRIHADGHQLYTVKQVKVSLNFFDNKRYILPNGVDTLALGHYKTVRIDDEDDV